MSLILLEKQQIVMIFDVCTAILCLLAAGMNINEYQFISSKYQSALCLIEGLHEYAIDLDNLFLCFLVELGYRLYVLDVMISLLIDLLLVQLSLKEGEKRVRRWASGLVDVVQVVIDLFKKFVFNIFSIFDEFETVVGAFLHKCFDSEA